MRLRDISADPIGKLVQPTFCNAPWYHFSVDDVFDSLIEVTDKNIPFFEHPFFALMQEMHDYAGTQVDLELFYEKEIEGIRRTLADVRDLSDELRAAKNWLRFGPHAESYLTAPFEQSPKEQIKVFNNIYNEIERFAGDGYKTTWVRLHYYSESFELAEYFKTHGVTALFSTDRSVGSHRMPGAIGESLLENGFATYAHMNFIRTQYRIEDFTNNRVTENDLESMFLRSLERFGYIVFYSHEYEFARSEVRNMLRKTFKVLDGLGVKSIHQKI